MSKRLLNKRILLLLVLSCVLLGCKEELLHDLTEGEANRLTTLLQERGISVQKQAQGELRWMLTTSREDSQRALSFLNTYRLVRENRGKKNEGNSILSSREAQRRQLEQNLAESLEGTLQAIPGVIEARVHLHLPTSDALREKEAEDKSASVLLVLEENTQIKSEAVAIVVRGAAGIRPEDVYVVITRIPELARSHASQKEHIIPQSTPGIKAVVAPIGEQSLLINGKRIFSQLVTRAPESVIAIGVSIGLLLPLLMLGIARIRNRKREVIASLHL